MRWAGVVLLIAFLTNPFAHGFGGISSEMPSTFLMVSTPNTHLVDRAGDVVILRGSAPRGEEDLESLRAFGIKRILIFKNETRDEVTREIQALKDLGYSNDQITHIAFYWKNFTSADSQCEKTIVALRQIEDALQKGESLFFHCTVGEDRTGYLAALWKLWINPRLTPYQLFEDEMCAHGYEAKNPKKPEENVRLIRAYLTPFYFLMADLLQTAARERKSLKDIQCPKDEFLPRTRGGYRCA